MAVIEAIATTYLEANAASVTFSSLGSYEHLQLRISAKSDYTGASSDEIELNFNGDTTANYAYHRIIGSETATSASSAASASFVKVPSIQSSAAKSGAENYGGLIVDILDYKDDGNKNTTVAGTSCINRVTSALLGGSQSAFFSGLWDNTDDVTSIVLAPSGGSNFIRGSEFTLYGLNSS